MLPSLIIVLITISLLVFVHELGHFLVAKKAGIKVEEFGFGYPPRIWGKKIGETIYSLNVIPFGGFVRLLGQDRQEGKKLSPQEKKRAFFAQSKKARIAVLTAGVLGNFILGIFCFNIIYFKTGIPENLGYIKVIEVIENSPAQKAGLKKDDQILALASQKVSRTNDFIKIIEAKKGKELKIKTNRGKFKVIPQTDETGKRPKIGVVITDVSQVFYPWWQMLYKASFQGIKEAVFWGGMILLSLGLSIKQLFSGIMPQLGGPVMVAKLTGQAAKAGFLELINFTGILSINLAVLNLLPFPALDGGHLVFVFVGDMLGFKKREKIERVLNLAGFIFLISLMILVTINDIWREFGQSISLWLKTLKLF